MRVLETEVKTPHKTFMKTVSVPVDMDAESIKKEIAFQIKQDLKNIQKPDLSTTFEVEIDGN